MPRDRRIKEQLARKQTEQVWDDPFDYSDPGTELLAAGTRSSRGNDASIQVEDLQDLLKMLQYNLQNRRMRLGGLFGGENPRYRK